MGKRMEAAVKAYDKSKTYTFEEAANIVKTNAKAKFDETVELHVKLGIDTKKPISKCAPRWPCRTAPVKPNVSRLLPKANTLKKRKKPGPTA